VPSSPSLPRDVGGLRLVRELGRGGMGIVYEALELGTGRTVAVKVLMSDLVLSGEAFERFQREARLAASISHSHCVFVYGAQKIDGSPAIVMELVGGETLEDKIRRGEPIPVQTAVRWMIDVLDGLEAAHRSGVLHRDVKPSNCFVTPEGRVKVGDFGLSRSIERDVQLTQTGQFLGSPLYASPEQIRGRSFDVRSDLYSCAATLYAVLAGKAPYSGSNVGEVLARILSEPPPSLRTARPDVPAELDHVVLRAMEREPEKRFADLNEFRDALLPFATGKVEVASPWRRIGAYVVDSSAMALLSGLFMLTGKAMDWEAFLPNEAGLFGTWWAQATVNVVPHLYYVLGEGWLGSTIGKWLFGIRVVSVATRKPTMLGAAVRSLVFFGPTIAIALVLYAFMSKSGDLSAPTSTMQWLSIAPLLIPVLMFCTARRRNGWRGLHDFASGTLTLPVTPPFVRTRLQTPPPEKPAEQDTALPTMLGDYSVEGVVGRTPVGRMLKARDTTLERSVWIHWCEADRACVDETRRTLARHAKLRWLGAVHSGSGTADVFESPGGTSLTELVASRGRIDWPMAQRLLVALIDEMKASGANPSGWAVEQIWVDRNWDLRLLDEPVGHGPFARRSEPELIADVARLLFLGKQDQNLVMPPDLPFHAEETVSRLIGKTAQFRGLDEVRAALSRLESGPVQIQRRTRSAQMALNVVLPAASTAFVAILGFMLASAIGTFRGLGSMVDDLQTGKIQPLEQRVGEEARPLDEDGRRARDILIVDALHAPWGAALARNMDENRELFEQVQARQPVPTEAEVAWAEAHIQTEGGRTTQRRQQRTAFHTVDKSDGSSTVIEVGTGLDHIAAVMAFVGTIAWGLFSLPLSFILAGGLMFTLFGIRIRDRRGRRAGRWLCGLRTTLAWLPLAAGTFGVLILAMKEHMVAATVLGSILGIVYVLAVIDAILNPTQSVVDRLLRTHLVPR